VARARAEAGDDDGVWRVLRWLASTRGGKAGAWFENDGARVAPPFAQLGFPPWTWAELITLFIHHLLGVRPRREGITLRPRLLEGLQRMEGSLNIGGHRLELTVTRKGPGEERGGLLEGDRLAWGDDGVRLPPLQTDVELELFW
jgi:hypothetical protein